MVFYRVASGLRTFGAAALMTGLSAFLMIGFHALPPEDAHTWPDSGLHNIPPPTPSPTAKPEAKRYTSREELLRDADKFAIEQLGFEDENGNGIPDYRETYVVNSHDCTTVSAEFDYIVDQMGKAGVMDPAQAQGTVQIRGGNHAANIVPGLGVVDVTPVGANGGYVASRGQPWYPFDRTGYTEYTDGFPDGGELTFKGYNGPRTNTAPGAVIRGSGGFGGGGAASLGMIGALSGLLQNGAFQPPSMAPIPPSSTSGKPSAGGGSSTQPAPVKTPSAQPPSAGSRSTQEAPAPTSTTKASSATRRPVGFLDSQLGGSGGEAPSPATGETKVSDRNNPAAWDVSAFPPLVPRPMRSSW